MRCKIWFTLILLQSGGENLQYSSSCHLQIKKVSICLFSSAPAVTISASSDAVMDLSSSMLWYVQAFVIYVHTMVTCMCLLLKDNQCVCAVCVHMYMYAWECVMCAHTNITEFEWQWVTVHCVGWWSMTHLSWTISKLSFISKFKTLHCVSNLGKKYKLLVIALLNHYLGLCHCIYSVGVI